MSILPGWVVWGMISLGCQVLAALAANEAPPAAETLWQQGQEAMRQGRPAEAVACYEQSLIRAPELTRNYLSLAAAYLELGSSANACTQLGRYVVAHPEDTQARTEYAELLARVGKVGRARAEYERCVADAQAEGAAAASLLIRCHSRLMEMAEALEDAYAEHLHRGIGLYLLARESEDLAEAEAALPSEGLFCKAAGELTLALEERPDEARPNWYLYAVWTRLGQRPLAQRSLRDAGEAAPFSYLTPVEQRGLHLASQGPGAVCRAR